MLCSSCVNTFVPIGLDLYACAKLAVIWIINNRLLLSSKPNLSCDLSYFSFVIVNFVHLELFFLRCIFSNFLSENK